MTIFIALLIALGFVNSTEDFNNKTEQEKQDLIEIVIVEDIYM